jgi:hypothetical protein
VFDRFGQQRLRPGQSLAETRSRSRLVKVVVVPQLGGTREGLAVVGRCILTSVSFTLHASRSTLRQPAELLMLAD